MQSVIQVSLFSTLKLLTDTFAVKQLHTCHVIQYYIITIHFWLKYNGLGIVQRTTKLVEGGHRDIQAYTLKHPPVPDRLEPSIICNF